MSASIPENVVVTPPEIVQEVTVESGAVFALTKNNAVFRNGQQLVIPHIGVPFMTELMEALTSTEFVGAIVENAVAEQDKQTLAAVAGADPYCGHYGVDVMETCNAPEGHDGPHTYTDERGGVTAWHDHFDVDLEEAKANLKAAIEATPKEVCGDEAPTGGATCLDFAGHEGPHQGYQGGPPDWGGGDDIEWENDSVTPSRAVPEETSWEGFIIRHHGNKTSADVYHPKSTKRIGLADRAMAKRMLADPFIDFYDRLCATGYIEWFDIYFPGEEDWREWTAGDSLVSDKGARALVIPWQDSIAVVNDEGTYYTLDDRNAETFRHWTKVSR